MEGEKPAAEDQMRMKWESLHQEFSTKQKLLQDALEQEQEQVVPNISLPYTKTCRGCTALPRQYNCAIIYIFIINTKIRRETNYSLYLFIWPPLIIMYLCVNI